MLNKVDAVFAISLLLLGIAALVGVVEPLSVIACGVCILASAKIVEISCA
jgi:hypothetical protein